METKIKRRISVLVVLGMFMSIALVTSVVAPDADTDVGVDGSYSVNIDQDNDESDRIFRVTHNGDPGTELIRVQETGEVGIGTTGPDRKLDVLDTSGAQLRLTYTDGSVYTDFQTTSSGDLFIQPIGNAAGARVGIATSSPQATLHVGGVLGSAPGSIDRIAITGFSSAGPWIITARNDVSNAHLDLSYGGITNILTTRDDGNVGIGTTSPQNKLDVEGAAVIGATYSGTNTAPTNGLLVEGNVGIGTTGPDRKLDVLDSSNPQLRLTHTDGSTYADFQVDTNHDLLIQPSSTGQIKLQPTTDSTDFFQVLDADGGDPVLNVDATNERVGIGISPLATLHVDGDVALGQGNELTISGGVVTVTHSYHHIDTESDAATDNLDTINGGIAGQILIIRNSHASRDVVVRDGTGNIILAGGIDFTMEGTIDTLTLIYSGANWLEISRSDN